MAQAAIVRDEPIRWGKNPIRNLRKDEVAILTGPAVKSIEVSSETIAKALSMYLGRYTHMYVVNTSSFKDTHEEVADSAEPLYDFKFRIDLMARVRDARAFVDQFGPGKTVFDPFYDQVRGHLQNLSQDFLPSELVELRKTFNEISEDVREGKWTAGPVEVLSCNINASLGPKTLEVLKALQTQDLVDDRGPQYLLYKGETELLAQLHEIQNNEEDRELARLEKVINLVETSITDQDFRDQILGETGIADELKRWIRAPEPKPKRASRPVTDSLLPQKKEPIRLLTRK